MHNIMIGNKIKVVFGCDFVDGTKHQPGQIIEVTESNLSYFQHPQSSAFYTKVT